MLIISTICINIKDDSNKTYLIKDWYKPSYIKDLFFVKLPRHLEKNQSISDMIKEEYNEGLTFG